MELQKQENVPLAAYTTLHVGGVADFVVEVRSQAELEAARLFAEQTNVPLLILGGGSNVLISDKGYRGLVILMRTKGVTVVSQSDTEVVVRVEAGEGWDDFVAYTVEQGWSGLENLSGIPGTVGASPVQNINAYGASVADSIVSVDTIDSKTGEVKTIANEACSFGYRDSIFKQAAGASYIVTAVMFKLAPAATANLTYRSSSQSIARYLAERGITTPSIADVREAVLHARATIGMLEGQFRSAGSFFKNTIVSADQFAHIQKIVSAQFAELGEKMVPWYWTLPDGQVKVSTAFLMECSPYNKSTYGVKRWNAVVGLSPKHSLSIVTEEGATATDVVSFSQEVIAAVQTIFSITIEAEVDFIQDVKNN